MFRYSVVLIVITSVLSEPECSRFHYEEQTLNKVIRQEIAMEKLKSDMEKTQQQMLDALSGLKEITQQLSDDWNYAETNMKRLADETRKKTDESEMKYALEMEKIKGPSVAFRSKDVADLTPKSGETLVFKTTTLNEGLGYDNMTGVFTAPVAGKYAFSVQLCVINGNNMFYAIVSENVSVKMGLFYDARGNLCYNLNTFIILQKGSNVHVICSKDQSALTTSRNYWNTFSGALVHA